jgi:hypothetical protein
VITSVKVAIHNYTVSIECDSRSYLSHISLSDAAPITAKVATVVAVSDGC